MELSQLTENVSILTEKDPVIAGQWSVKIFGVFVYNNIEIMNIAS